MTNSPPKLTNTDNMPFRIKPGFFDEPEKPAVADVSPEPAVAVVDDLVDTGDQPRAGVDQSLKTELEEGVDAIAATEEASKVNEIKSDENQLADMEKEELQSYPLYYEGGKVITLIVGQTWLLREDRDTVSKRISSISLSNKKDELFIGFNDFGTEEKSIEKWKRDFESAKLVSDGEHDLERAKIGEAIEYSTQSVKPEEASGVAYQDGKIAKENIILVPQVAVAPAAVEASAAGVAEEVAAGVPEEVIEAEKQVAQAVETVVPAVATKEQAEAVETQEPATATVSKDAAVGHDQFIKLATDANASAADKLEEEILTYNPESGDME